MSVDFHDIYAVGTDNLFAAIAEDEHELHVLPVVHDGATYWSGMFTEKVDPEAFYATAVFRENAQVDWWKS